MSFRFDPYKNFKFQLEIDGIVRAGFHESAGLDQETAGNEAASTISGLQKTGDVTLKRGIIGDLSILQWAQGVDGGKIEPKNGSIILMNESGEEKMRWNFLKGWPVKLEGPGLDAAGDEVAVERLEIAYEGLTEGQRKKTE